MILTGLILGTFTVYLLFKIFIETTWRCNSCGLWRWKKKEWYRKNFWKRDGEMDCYCKWCQDKYKKK